MIDCSEILTPGSVFYKVYDNNWFVRYNVVKTKNRNVVIKEKILNIKESNPKKVWLTPEYCKQVKELFDANDKIAYTKHIIESCNLSFRTFVDKETAINYYNELVDKELELLNDRIRNMEQKKIK